MPGSKSRSGADSSSSTNVRDRLLAWPGKQFRGIDEGADPRYWRSLVAV